MRLITTESPESPAVSIVIRARDESRFIARCLAALEAQDFPRAAEVVLVDSGSGDGTVDIARRWPVRVVEIRPSDFTYSSALNLGFRAARSPFVASLSAHAIPVDARWVSTLVHHFEDPRVAGVYSRELPWPDADLYERLRLESCFPPFGATKSLEFALESGDLDRHPLLWTFSNAASMVRRDLWEERPFRELPYAEDIDWSRWALRQGHHIVYEPLARVWHSHREGAASRAEREVKGELALAEIFGRRPSLSGQLWRSLRANAHLAWRAARSELPWKERIATAAHASAKWIHFALRWFEVRRGLPLCAREPHSERIPVEDGVR